MPALSVKELYLATCIEKLDSDGKISDISKKSTSSLCKTAQKLYKSAEENHLAKDEEKAYVQYSRYVELILSIKKRPDFKIDKSNKSLSENAMVAMTKAENLRGSLLKRYSILQELELRKKNEKNGDIISEIAKPELPVHADIVDNTEKENVNNKDSVMEQSITSDRLYTLLLNPHLQSSIILMDVRPEFQFDESHIKHSSCISVPKEILRAGITAAAVEQSLPAESISKWQNRGEAEYIILIDTEKDEFTPGSSLHSLKQAMCVWDQNCTPKKPPMVLQGGYKDWMLKYPMYTTKAINFSQLNSNISMTPLADFSAVEYPNLDENLTERKNEDKSNDILFKKSKHADFSMMNGFSPSNDFETMQQHKVKSAPTINRKAKPTVDRGPKTAVSSNRNPPLNDINNESVNNITISMRKASLEDESPSKILPNINRKLKPTVTATVSNSLSNSDLKKETSLMTALGKEESLAKEALEIAMQQLQKENEFEKLCMRKGLEAEESKRIEIQKQEDMLIERMKQLEEQSIEKDKAYNKIKEENIKMKKLLEEKMDKDLQKQREKDILEAENKKRSLQEQVERLREMRKRSEQTAQKKIDAVKPIVIPREISSASSVLKRHQSHNEPELSKQSNSSEYTIPLSKQSSVDSSSRGLVRSHSSPNIAEMVNQEESIPRKLPVVDRSLKPKTITPTQDFEINRARLRNLNPVYGNSLVRSVTGIRNLGNTCFMNSIIQCLSNTLPLAMYFNSGQYMEDINRENRHGTGGDLAEEFAVVIRALWMGQYKSFSPKDFKNTVSRCLSVCIGNEQQDSHEFLVVLMDKLHADLNKKSEKLQLPKLDDIPEHIAKDMFWKHHKRINSSKISEIFDGLLKSTLTCMTCQKTSNNFEVFSCLSLPISSSRCSLRDCLQNFLKPEKMSGEAAWDCPRCKQKKEAEKRLHICRLPNILIIQLKRFSYDGMWRRKLQTHVDFEMMFEMPYEDNSEIRSRSYTLYGIVNHYGTLEGGHYTAYCKNNSVRKWYKYDDHEVSEISPSDIKTSAAYLLFYTAVDCS